MQYEQKDISVDNLIEADYNPRQISPNDFESLKDSISKFGMAEPLVVNGNAEREGIVIGGHQRLRACKALGMKNVPCFVVSLTKEEEMELNVRLNRNQGEFDYDALANIFDAGDLIDWGMTARELDMEFDLPDDGEPEPTKQKKEKEYNYKLSFNNESELDEWYEFLAELKLSTDDEKLPTITQKILKYIKDNPIQI